MVSNKDCFGTLTLFTNGRTLGAPPISPSENLLIFARLFLGVAVGVASFTAPLYISEISPKKVRGSLTSMYRPRLTS